MFQGKSLKIFLMWRLRSPENYVVHTLIRHDHLAEDFPLGAFSFHHMQRRGSSQDTSGVRPILGGIQSQFYCFVVEGTESRPSKDFALLIWKGMSSKTEIVFQKCCKKPGINLAKVRHCEAFYPVITNTIYTNNTFIIIY